MYLYHKEFINFVSFNKLNNLLKREKKKNMSISHYRKLNRWFLHPLKISTIYTADFIGC